MNSFWRISFYTAQQSCFLVLFLVLYYKLLFYTLSILYLSETRRLTQYYMINSKSFFIYFSWSSWQLITSLIFLIFKLHKRMDKVISSSHHLKSISTQLSSFWTRTHHMAQIRLQVIFYWRCPLLHHQLRLRLLDSTQV